MATHRTLVLKSRSESLFLDTVPKPTAGPGSVVVRILGTYILPYLKDVLNGTLPYPLVTPITPGSNCIARVHSVGPDSISLEPGQLVFCDTTVRARDDPSSAILLGLHGGAAMKLMEGEWRNGSFAEYAKFPLENVFPVNEEVLCGKMGYSIDDLVAIPSFLVPFGGFCEINILPGDSVIVAPSTGRFGGGAVTMALAMGASVIACGRNEKILNKMKEVFSHTGRLSTLIMTGRTEDDTRAMIAAAGNNGKGADAYIDFSPAAAANSTHISSALAALKPRGRAAFMGGIPGKIEINYIMVMMKSLRIQGRFMYDREMILHFIKMIEKGNLKLGEEATGIKTVGKFGLDEIDQALELAKEKAGWGGQVVLIP